MSEQVGTRRTIQVMPLLLSAAGVNLLLTLASALVAGAGGDYLLARQLAHPGWFGYAVVVQTLAVLHPFGNRGHLRPALSGDGLLAGVAWALTLGGLAWCGACEVIWPYSISYYWKNSYIIFMKTLASIFFLAMLWFYLSGLLLNQVSFVVGLGAAKSPESASITGGVGMTLLQAGNRYLFRGAQPFRAARVKRRAVRHTTTADALSQLDCAGNGGLGVAATGTGRGLA